MTSPDAVIALSRAPKPRVSYRVQPVKGGFVVVDDTGDAWSAVYRSDVPALSELRRVRRGRAAFEYAQDRLARIELSLVERHLVRDAAAARRVIEDVLA